MSYEEGIREQGNAQGTMPAKGHRGGADESVGTTVG